MKSNLKLNKLFYRLFFSEANYYDKNFNMQNQWKQANTRHHSLSLFRLHPTAINFNEKWTLFISFEIHIIIGRAFFVQRFFSHQIPFGLKLKASEIYKRRDWIKEISSALNLSERDFYLRAGQIAIMIFWCLKKKCLAIGEGKKSSFISFGWKKRILR